LLSCYGMDGNKEARKAELDQTAVLQSCI